MARVAPSVKLTERQTDVILAIRAVWYLTGRGPTYRELAKILQVTPHAVVDIVMRLRVLGVVEWHDRRWRSIRVVGSG